MGEGKIKKKKEKRIKKKEKREERKRIKRKFCPINNASPTCPLVNAMVSAFFNPA